jgi:bifunctional DNA-binding transcriptional regulator/antitoxin component of YhaV-PrlF toxin-antitoxin module
MEAAETVIYGVRHILPMTEIDLTTMSSKGQVVIPSSLRRGVKSGTRYVVLRKGDTYVLKKADSLDAAFAEDLEFAQRTERAWQEYRKGGFASKSKKDFLAELEKW